MWNILLFYAVQFYKCTKSSVSLFDRSMFLLLRSFNFLSPAWIVGLTYFYFLGAIAGCINQPIVPSGTWYCKICQNQQLNDKSVERNVNAVAAGRVPGVDPIQQIANRCIRIINTEEIDFGGCALCRCLHIFYCCRIVL